MNESSAATMGSLKKSIETLISRLESVIAERNQLKQNLLTTREELNYYKSKTTELEQKVQNLQIAQAFKASSLDVKEAKQKINKLVKEIDKCIALLNN